MLTDKDIEEAIESNTAALRKVAKKAYLEGKRDATRDWAWWKDGTQYVGTCGKTLAQALDIIAEEEATN